MNSLKSYIIALAALTSLSAGLTACQDDFDAPSVETPVATIQANTTIAELKALFWDDATNYAKKIPAKENGEHYVIAGRVISSDEAGNVFKSITIQDATGAMAFSVNSYNLYLKYRRGQEIVIDVTEMNIGKYAGLQQFGTPSWYENGNTWQVGFMAPEVFAQHLQLNGLPELAALDTITVNSMDVFSTSPEGLRKWQSQLVRINNVHFQDGGTATFSAYKSNSNDDVNRTLLDSKNNSIIVRTSGYANFWNKKLPEGNGDIVGLLSFYQSLNGSSNWQLILLDYEGCMNFGNPTIAPGTEDKPYSVEEAIAIEAAGDTERAWVSGYIVGSVDPDADAVTSNSNVIWSAQTISPYTLVIGQTAETKDINSAVVIELPADSKLREVGNLRDNPANYGKKITVYGELAKVMGTFGVVGNTGTPSEFKIEGVEISDGSVPTGDGTQASPFNASQVIALNPTSKDTPVAGGENVWIKGYIVGWMPTTDTFLSNTVFNGQSETYSNIVIASTPTEIDYKKCVPVQLVSGSALRAAVNLKDNPGNYGKLLSIKGSVMLYCGAPGLKSTTEYELEGGGGDTPVVPPTTDPVSSIDQNFDASSEIPAGWTQVQAAGNKAWYVPTFNNNNYAAMTGYKGTAPFDQCLVTPPVDMSKVTEKKLTFDTQVNGYGSTTTKLEVYVMTAAQPAAGDTKLNPTLAVAPAADPSTGKTSYSSWVNSGSIDLSAYSGIIYIGFRYVASEDANYATWCVDNVKLGATGGTTPDEPDTPVTPSGEYKGDFNTFNSGKAVASPYATYTNATGWTADWSIVLGGSDSGDKSPNFAFIGSPETLAPTLNGNTGKVGKLTSPTLTGGIKTLTFKYGFAFNESKCSFTVKVLQGGNVVKEDTVTLESIEKLKAYDYSLDVNVTGDFKIEIVNNCLSAAASNKDRVSIWNLTWTN